MRLDQSNVGLHFDFGTILGPYHRLFSLAITKLRRAVVGQNFSQKHLALQVNTWS